MPWRKFFELDADMQLLVLLHLTQLVAAVLGLIRARVRGKLHRHGGDDRR